jgi:hypothetical protein
MREGVMESRVYGAVLAGCLLVAVVSTVLLYGLTYGDPSIHFVYAKNMWEHGFFHYNALGPSSGSSSPVWTVLLSPLFLLPRPDHAVRIFSIAVFFAGAWVAYRVTRALTGRRECAWVGTAVWLVLFPAHHLTAVAFETVFAAALFLAVGGAFLLQLDREDARPREVFLLGAAAGLLPLARMELALACVLMFAALLLLRTRRALPFALGGVVTSLPYFLWSLAATGSVVPQSAGGRMIGEVSYLANVLSLGATMTRTLAPVGVALLLGTAVLFWRGAWRARAVWAVAALFGVVFIVLTPRTHLLVRYVFPVLVPCAVVLAAMLAQRVLEDGRHRRRLAVSLGVAAFLALYGATVVRRSYSMHRSAVPVYNWDMVFERDLVNQLNAMVSPRDTVLLYEIQAQYFLNAPALSLDGIVGGEVLPYLHRGSDLSDFLREYRPRWWVANNAVFYREELKNTLLARVQKKPPPMGGSVQEGGITFTRVLQRETEVPDRFGGGWQSVYRLDYEPPPDAAR